MGSPLNGTPGQDSFPSEFGEFRLLGRLARGRQGDVYYAVRGGGGREAWVALKRLAPDLAIDRELCDRWLRAADRAAQLDHPVLCRTLGTGTFEGSPFCAMELCEGLDLARICERLKERDEAMPVRCAAFVMSRVAAALDAAHHHDGAGWTGVAHGDLTPSDVIVGADGSVKVTNLGLSKALEPEHAAPQPVVSDADVSADVVAMGRCLSALLGSSHETLRVRPSSTAQAGDPDSEPSGINALRMVAARAIRPRAGARLEGAAAFGRALDQFLAARGNPFAVETLSTWMNATFQPDLLARRNLERRIMDALAVAVISKPRRSERPIAAFAATPTDIVLSSVQRSDPDKTPPHGMLAERLASEMWTDDEEPTRVGQVLRSHMPPAADAPAPASMPPAAREPVRSTPPLSSNAAPLWAPSQPPRAASTALRVGLACAAMIGVVVALTQRGVEPSGKRRAEPEHRATVEHRAQPEPSVEPASAPAPLAGPPAATPDIAPEPIVAAQPAVEHRPRTHDSKRRRSTRAATSANANDDQQDVAMGEATTDLDNAAQPASDAVHEAVLTSRQAPRFPALALERGVRSGNVLLSFTVDSAGNVRDPMVVQSTPPGLFDAAAIEAVSKWRYRPRSEAGVPVESRGMQARLDFSDAR